VNAKHPKKNEKPRPSSLLSLDRGSTSKQHSITYYQVNPTCSFDKCGLEEMRGKKWASIEDAGILLCTKAPDKVDCLKYNMEYRKLMKL